MHAQLIDDLVRAFGCESQAEFGRLLGVQDRRVVNNWKRDGLPWRRWAEIKELAGTMNVELPESFPKPMNRAA